MPPERIHRAQRVRGVGPLNMSQRKVKGAGWHRRGWRDNGRMWINIKDGSYGPVHGMDVNENDTLARFVRYVVYRQTMSDYYPQKEGWTWDLQFRRKSLIAMLDEFEEEGIPEDEVLVRDYFDGGETVIFKVFDEYGRQR
ncbi:hypothetical protein GGS26DRAFT_542816 [Hypomontagnella submonticulosa]|nr:hypothetical protein GGS26DRAFT_542816 [Hypomontagnella submonticulosa]